MVLVLALPRFPGVMVGHIPSLRLSLGRPHASHLVRQFGSTLWQNAYNVSGWVSPPPHGHFTAVISPSSPQTKLLLFKGAITHDI